MGSISTVELAAAVTDAGGLGMLALVGLPVAQVIAELERAAATADGPLGVNFLMPFLDEAAAEEAARRARVVELFYGDPSVDLVARVHAGGALASWQVGSADEARAAADAGCDFVVAQGAEAGGHVRGELPLLAVLDGVLGAVDLPVLGAGGIATARGVAAVLAAGAAGARVGTRFIATPECDAHPRYLEALLASGGDDTTITGIFSVMWPGAPHRVLRSCIEAASTLGGDIAGETLAGGTRVPVPKFSPLPPTRETSGQIDAMALYAGQGVGAVTEVMPAADVVRELAEGAEALLRR